MAKARHKISDEVCGVYEIKNVVNGKVYVGSSFDVGARWYYHVRELSKKIHINRHLTSAWHKYGPQAFAFSILEVVPVALLMEREQYWIEATKCYEARFGYNVYRVPNSPLGLKRSAETRKKIGDVQRERKASAETRLKMSAASAGIKKSASHTRNISRGLMFFQGEKLDELIRLRAIGVGVTALAARFGCDRHTVRKTLSGHVKAIGKDIDPLPIDQRPTGRQTEGKPRIFDDLAMQEITAELAAGKTIAAIAAERGVHLTTVYRSIERYRHATS